MTLLQTIRRHWLLAAALLLALGARLTYWLYTGRVVDDALITVTHARNAALGLGLVHHLGEGRVHGFTSALSVLVPLAGELVRHGSGIDTMRVASLLAAAATLVYAYLIARRLALGAWATAFLLAYLALDHDQILWGMAGMETQIATATLLAGVYHLLEERRLAIGACLGLALLARPDFVLFAGPALLLLFRRDRRAALREGAVMLAVVAPWVIFTTLYYGSPIPHTIVAKAGGYVAPPASLAAAPGWLLSRVGPQLNVTVQYFVPLYSTAEVTAAPVSFAALLPVATIVVILAVTGCVWLRRTPLWAVVPWYVLLFLAYRIVFLPGGYYGPWYVPPFTAMVALAAAAGISATSRRYRLFVPPLAVALVALYALPFAVMLPIDRDIQTRIEAQVRTRLGEYLHDAVPPGQSVTSESAGYVGFYGDVKLWDFPGLTSPTASDALARLPPQRRTLEALVDAVHPDWVVFRPTEYDLMRQEYPRTAAEYSVVRTFSVDVPLEHWGVRVANIDQAFYVLRRE
jgi:hypothetical protein